ncbi:hypothetical protein EVG20_g3358 [Dentipellis fragilis]|uniref:Aminoglycoside phosphotransferase domain-containing protein n=1 Tax=Dentipellis fragilis TaxID=205917 RepID=A0A4Y9Z524_9AGAM|nr:hypothetical protein EVG20_g3358 [Dentipellis fragilis]
MKYRGDFAEEVRATLYARKHFSFPIPRVLRHPPLDEDLASGSPPPEVADSQPPGVWYICTEQCPGVSLDKVIDTMTPAQLNCIAEQLRHVLAEMDQIRPTTLGSVTGGPYRNEYFPVTILPPRAFSSYPEFLDLLREVLMNFATETYTEDLLSKIPRNASMRFAHADLYPGNIIVNGTITGIIDWATAGYWPEFWEYCTMHRPVSSSLGWDQLLSLVFPGERRQAEIDAVTTLGLSPGTFPEGRASLCRALLHPLPPPSLLSTLSLCLSTRYSLPRAVVKPRGSLVVVLVAVAHTSRPCTLLHTLTLTCTPSSPCPSPATTYSPRLSALRGTLTPPFLKLHPAVGRGALVLSLGQPYSGQTRAPSKKGDEHKMDHFAVGLGGAHRA